MSVKNNPLAFKRGYGTQEERVTMGVPTISTDHASIHEGIAFTTAGTMSVPTGQTGALFLKVPGDQATVTINMTAALADLTYTAVAVGTAGNAITVTHVDPGGVTATLGCTVVGNAITINLGRAASAINSTAAAVKALVNAHSQASLLVTCEDEGVGSGLVNAISVTSLAGGTDKTWCHFNAALIRSTAAITVSLLEQYTKAPGDIPSALTPKNRNRNSATTSQLTVTGGVNVTPTQATGFGTLATAAIGADLPAYKVGGDSASAYEWILKPGYNYCIACANASGSTAVVSYDMFWYEEEGA